MEKDIIQSVQDELLEYVVEKTAGTYQRYFKEKVKYHGVSISIVNRVASKFSRQIKHLEKKEIFRLCEKLLETDFGEEAAIAFNWAYGIRRQYEPVDFSIFQEWMEKYVNSWAKCDEFCNHAVGTLVEMYPEYISGLKLWAASDNRWLRRGAAVTMVLPARKGLFLREVFEIADILLNDGDDLVRKGYGWMLKEASRKHQREVFDYVVGNRATMPRVALRYSIELMPQELKGIAMSREKPPKLL